MFFGKNKCIFIDLDIRNKPNHLDWIYGQSYTVYLETIISPFCISLLSLILRVNFLFLLICYGSVDEGSFDLTVYLIFHLWQSWRGMQINYAGSISCFCKFFLFDSNPSSGSILMAMCTLFFLFYLLDICVTFRRLFTSTKMRHWPPSEPHPMSFIISFVEPL